VRPRRAKLCQSDERQERKLITRKKDSDRPSGTDGDGRKCGQIEKLSRNKWKSTLELPKQTTFYCPICDCSYNVYLSITRHITLKHEAATVEYLYKCCECDKIFESRKELGKHSSADHPTEEPAPPPCRKGSYQCSFCDESFATQRGQAQHERNRHPIRLSKLLANLAS